MDAGSSEKAPGRGAGARHGPRQIWRGGGFARGRSWPTADLGGAASPSRVAQWMLPSLDGPRGAAPPSPVASSSPDPSCGQFTIGSHSRSVCWPWDLGPLRVLKSFDLSVASQVCIFLLSVMFSKDILLQYMVYGQCVQISSI